MSGNDFDLHANVKVDIQFFNSPHLTAGGREKHLWMLGVWSISSVSRLWRLYRLFHQRPAVPIEFTAIVCQALHLWFSPQACFAFYLFWRFSRRQQKFDLGQERKSLIRSKCQWVCPCHPAQIRRRWKQLGRANRDLWRANRDLRRGGFLLKPGRQVDTTWAQWGENSWRTLESSVIDSQTGILGSAFLGS